jgi:sugar phosphate isomerase/epimerase
VKVTRREWHSLVIGGLVAAPLARVTRGQAARINSTFAGVRIGAQSYSFRDRSLDATITAMRDIGLGFCELWQSQVETPQAVGVPPGRRNATREEIRQWRLTVPMAFFREIRQKFDAAGILLTAYNLSFRDDFTDDEVARGFEMAKALGVDVITASSNVTTAAKVDPFAKAAGIKVAFHNHSNLQPNEFARPDDFAEAMKKTSAMININLDIGHFTAANFDAVEFLDAHHDRILSIHIKDRKRNQGDNVPFGEGDTPIIPVLRRLRDRKWDIPAHIEYEYRAQDTVAEVRKCFEYCKAALQT